MSNLVATREAIATRLRTALALPNVHTHGGAITLDELKKLGPVTPAVLVACLGFPKATVQGSQTFVEAAFGCFVVTQDAVKDKRDVTCLALAESVGAEVIAQNSQGRWGGAANGPAFELAGTNLFTTALNQAGLSLWLVRWRQRVDLKRMVAADLAAFETLWATYNIAQTDMDETNDPADTVPTEDDIEVPQ